VFDLDGTLMRLDVDIERVRAEVAAMFAGLGHRAEFRPILAGIDAAAASIAGEDAAARRQLRGRARAIIDRAEVDAAGRAAIADDTGRLLRQLSAAGARLGIATNNGRPCAEVAVARLGERGARFTDGAVVTRDDVERWKPAPDAISRAARKLLPGGGTLWVVGDSPVDVAAARAAALDLGGVTVRAAAVLGGDGAEAALAAARPDRLLARLGDLDGALEGR